MTHPLTAPLFPSPARDYAHNDASIEHAVRTSFRDRLIAHLKSRGVSALDVDGFLVVFSHNYIVYNINLGFVPHEHLVKIDPCKFVVL